MTRNNWLFALAVGFGVLCLDLPFLSKAYVFEGLARALPIEVGRWNDLLSGNYLLYGPLGWLFYHLAVLLGFHGLAVTALQLMDALLGAAGAGLYFLLWRRLGETLLFSVSAAALLSVSLGYWLWSTEAENYIFSTFLQSLAFYLVVAYIRGARVSGRAFGAVQTLLMLGHVVNVLFSFVILWAMIRVEKGKTRLWATIGSFVATTAVSVGILYGAVLGALKRPDHWSLAVAWVLGSANSPEGMRTGGGFSFEKWRAWLTMTAHIFISFCPTYTSPAAPHAAKAWVATGAVLLGAMGCLLLMMLRRLFSRERALAGACLIWLVSYAIMFSRWQPTTMVYRVSDLIPAMTLLLLGVRMASQQLPILRVLPIVTAFVLAVGNGSAELRPRSFETNNFLLQRMFYYKAHTPADGLFLTSVGEELYVPYFAERRPIVIGRYRFNPSELILLLQRLLQEEKSVYAASPVLNQEPWENVLSSFPRTIVGTAPDGAILYRLGAVKKTPN